MKIFTLKRNKRKGIYSRAVNWLQNNVYILRNKIPQSDETSFEKSYDRLLKIMSIGTGADDVDKAIILFATLYLSEDKTISEDLHLNLAELSDLEKRERLLKILEIGTGITGIENISAKLLAFYKAKGISFPINI